MAIKKTVEVAGIEVVDAYWYITDYIIKSDVRSPFAKVYLKAFKDKATRDAGQAPLGGEESYRVYSVPFNLVGAALTVPDGDESALDKIYDYIVNTANDGIIKPGYQALVGDQRNPEGITYVNANDEEVTQVEATCSYFYDCEIVA